MCVCCSLPATTGITLTGRSVCHRSCEPGHKAGLSAPFHIRATLRFMFRYLSGAVSRGRKWLHRQGDILPLHSGEGERPPHTKAEPHSSALFIVSHNIHCNCEHGVKVRLGHLWGNNKRVCFDDIHRRGNMNARLPSSWQRGPQELKESAAASSLIHRRWHLLTTSISSPQSNLRRERGKKSLCQSETIFLKMKGEAATALIKQGLSAGTVKIEPWRRAASIAAAEPSRWMIDLCKSFFFCTLSLLRASVAAEDGEDTITALSTAPAGCPGD